MGKTLVVVAHHNNAENLKRWLHYKGTNPVLVVDTGSPPEMILPFMEDAENNLIVRTPYRGYDTGAYLWAYYNFRYDNYLFVQDSCYPRDADFVEQFANLMPKNGLGAVGWTGFDMNIWDSNEQRAAIEWMYGKEWPKLGIFGPIFYTSRISLDRLAARGLLPSPPLHKQHAQGMERAWAIAFHRAGMNVNFMVEEFAPRRETMAAGGYPAMTKMFAGRA